MAGGNRAEGRVYQWNSQKHFTKPLYSSYCHLAYTCSPPAGSLWVAVGSLLPALFLCIQSTWIHKQCMGYTEGKCTTSSGLFVSDGDLSLRHRSWTLDHTCEIRNTFSFPFSFFRNVSHMHLYEAIWQNEREPLIEERTYCVRTSPKY